MLAFVREAAAVAAIGAFLAMVAVWSDVVRTLI